MAAKLPALNAETNTCSLMAWGFDAEISAASPYHGAVFAVTQSLAKIIAAGGSRGKCWLTFQEYFERLGEEPSRWGKPAAALLGALDAQLGLELAAIGGKDSMSGSFEKLDVPPTLVSFAVSVTKQQNIMTPEFKQAGSFVYILRPASADFAELRRFFDAAERVISEPNTLSAWAVGPGGTAEAIVKMCLGNHLGFEAARPLTAGGGFGGFVIESSSAISGVELLGRTIAEYTLKTPAYEISLEKLQHAWEQTLEPVYPSLIEQSGTTESFTYSKGIAIKPQGRVAAPRFVIPVFPGTNSEYDTTRAIEKAGGRAEVLVVRNISAKDIAESVRALAAAIDSAQIIVIPGGFSGGDEPDGSGKFITAFFRNAAISSAVADLLQKRDGLMCGICNGFQALIKLGLVPYGEIRDMDESSPTLTFNKIGRHQSTLVRTRICSKKSPWLSHLELGGDYLVPISHGEGRFIASGEIVAKLAANGQIATQYVDLNGEPTQDIRFNPNGSDFSIEGVTSPDGRVFGRMGHNERYDDGLFKNVPGTRKMDIFAGAVGYFN
jgi:phosphoribosylformylglycinamidine synthase